jgi:hypothetical protein
VATKDRPSIMAFRCHVVVALLQMLTEAEQNIIILDLYDGPCVVDTAYYMIETKLLMWSSEIGDRG